MTNIAREMRRGAVALGAIGTLLLGGCVSSGSEKYFVKSATIPAGATAEERADIA